MKDLNAYGKLNTGIARILQKYPLFGGLVASWTIHEDPTIDTMGVGMGLTGIILYYAPAFVNSITLDGVVAVLHHEVRHVVYGHVYADREAYPDHGALVIAEEVTVNEGLPEQLPIRGILLQDHPKLKPDQDTLTRYRILEKISSKSNQKATLASGSPGKGGGHPSSSQKAGTGAGPDPQGIGGNPSGAHASKTGL